MVFELVQPVTFGAFGPVSSACKNRVTLSPTVLVLKYSKIYISTSNGSNMLFNIKGPVYKHFSICPILSIPDINLYYSHV